MRADYGVVHYRNDYLGINQPRVLGNNFNAFRRSCTRCVLVVAVAVVAVDVGAQTRDVLF